MIDHHQKRKFKTTQFFKFTQFFSSMAATATAIHLLAATTNTTSSRRRTISISNDKFRTTQIVVIPKASASTENSSTGKKENKIIKKNNNSSTKNKKLKVEDIDQNEQIIKNNVEVEKSDSSDVIKRLDEVVNPVGLGRKSRQIFDQVWKKFSNLGQISRTEYDEGSNLLVYGDGAPIPGAQNTTVLVVGATSRIGRLVVRKLMLRGYSVKVMYVGCNLFLLLWMSCCS